MSVKRILRSIRLDKIAAVDSPCQQHATVAIIKRAPTAASLRKVSFDEALEASMVSSRVSEAFYRAFDNLWTRNDAFRTALTDELAAGGDGTEASEDYLTSVRSLVESAVEAARSEGVKATDESIEKAIENVLVAKFSPKGEAPMKITTKAELLGSIAKFAPATSPAADIAIIQKAATDLGLEAELPTDGPLAIAKADPALAILKREVAVLKFAPEARTYFDGLDAGAQDAFLAKSADDQAADIAKANATDPVLYTTTDGLAINKSAGPVVLALAKRADDLADRLAKAEGETASVTFEKRAATEFPNVAGPVAVAMLKSARQVGLDTDAGKAIVASLGTMKSASSGVFKRVGSEGVETAVTGSLAKARASFAGKVEAIAKRDSIGRADAMEKAQIEEPALFEEAYPQPEPATAGTAD